MAATEHAKHPLETATMRRVIVRLVPFLMLCYFFALLDRVNVGFAALQMNKDLGLTPAMFGFAASLFFVSYFLVEVPSNLALQKVGRAPLDRPDHDHLGLRHDGHGPRDRSPFPLRDALHPGRGGGRVLPGAILYLTYWLPSEYRARILATFTVSIPLATFLGSPLSVTLSNSTGCSASRAGNGCSYWRACPPSASASPACSS